MSADVPQISADVPLTPRRRTADTPLTFFSADVPLTYRRPTADVPLTSPPYSKGVPRPRWGLPGIPLGRQAR